MGRQAFDNRGSNFEKQKYLRAAVVVLVITLHKTSVISGVSFELHVKHSLDLFSLFITNPKISSVSLKIFFRGSQVLPFMSRSLPTPNIIQSCWCEIVLIFNR